MLFGALEAVASTVGAWRRTAARSDPTMPFYVVPDETIGWRPMPDRAIALDGTGRRYTSDARGWRRFENGGPRSPLLVIGDSFTQAAGVADGEVYYDLVARRLDLPVVALGVNGYGTLQEWLIANELRGELRPPAALVLQMTDNDAINDSLELERRSWLNNNLLRRPYLLADDRVELADPRRLFEHLALGRELTRRVLFRRMTSIETRIEAGDPMAVALYERELAPTGEALRRLRGLFPESPAVAFDVSGSGSRIAGDLLRLAREAGFRTFDVVDELARRAAGRGIVQLDGEHWNELGHALAGEIVAERLEAARVAAKPES